VGEQYNRDQYNPAHFNGGIQIPNEDMIKLRAHIAMMEETSSFELALYNFDKQYIETYPIQNKDFIRIFIGRGTVLPQVFQGRVEEVDAESEAIYHELTLKGRCIGEDLYRRLVTELFQNKEGAYVVRTLLDKYCTFLRHQRYGVELVETTDTTYTELEYDKSKLKDVLDFIAKTSDKAGVIGYDYRVEYDGLFAFFARGSKTSPISLTDVIKYANYRRTIHRFRNRIYVYGAAKKTVPGDGDYWTESLSNVDGVWSAQEGSVSLDSDEYKGSYCILLSSTIGAMFPRAIFTFNNPVNLNKLKTLFMALKSTCWGATGCLLNGTFRVRLWDINNFSAEQFIDQTNDGNYHEHEIEVGRKAIKWAVYNAGFDWTQIKKISIGQTLISGNDAYLRIDFLHFKDVRYGESFPYYQSTVAMPQENITDPADIREMVETDEELQSDAECVARAKAYLAWLKDEAELLTLQTEILDFGNNRIQPGDMQPVVLPNENVNKSFRVLSVDYVLDEEQELPITIELGKETPLLADYLYRLRKETSIMARLKAGIR
jgi:hypothetical protein